MLDIKERNGRLWIMGTLDGQRVRESTGYAVGAERAAREKLREKEKEIIDGRKKGPTVKEAVTDYLARVEGVGATSARYCREFAKKHGSTRIRGLDLGKVYKDAVAETGVVAGRKAQNTLRREIGAVQAMLNWNSELHGMGLNFRIKKPPKGEERLRFLEADEKKAMVDASEPWFRPLAVALFLTGMRRSEACGLRWHATREPMCGVLKGDQILVPTRKGKRGRIRWRTIDVHPDLAKALGQPGKVGEPVFKAPAGGPISDVTLVNKEWARTAARAGVDDTVPHDARRTFASDLLEAGVDLRTIADLLGHTKLDLLMLYAQVRGGKKKRSVALLPGV